MNAVLHKSGERYATGAPKCPPVWQLICEFANGTCVCAATEGEPCDAVAIMDRRIRNRVALDDWEAERRAKRKAAG